MALEMKVIAYLDIFQYEAGMKGIYSDEYFSLSAQIHLDKQDMSSLGVADGGKVLVENEVGRVVLTARTISDKSQPGVALMIQSPWSHQLEGDDPCPSVDGSGEAGFYGITAHVAPSQDGLTALSEIMQRIRA